MYCTLSPCTDCAEEIVNAGIDTVVFLAPYRKLGGVEYLKDHSISVFSMAQLEMHEEG